MASSKKVETFNGKGDVNVFLVKVDLYNKLKKYEDEEAAVSLASRLQEPAFNVYLRMSEADRKDINKIKTELKKQYQVGNRDREEALHLLSSCQRKEEETAQDFAFRITELVKLAYPTFSAVNKQVHEKDAFVKGLHPDMQMKIKTLADFADLDMKGLLDNTVRLEVAGVKSASKKYKEEINVVGDVVSNIGSTEGERKLHERLDGLEEAIAQLTVASNSSSARRRDDSVNRRSVGKSVRKCWICDDKSHLARLCPKRFCQSCGQKGHDAWNKLCPKFNRSSGAS